MNMERFKDLIGVVAIIKKGDRYLLGLESKDSPFRGKWRLLGGKVEAGETVEEALHKELMEEAKIRIKIKRYIRTVQGTVIKMPIHIYQAEWVSGEIIPKEDEHGQIRLFNENELKALDIEGMSRRALDEYLDSKEDDD
jgi:NAD+ diphosphatase